MKKGNMTPQKVNNFTIMNSKDNKVDEISKSSED
jgi:hypothetical protein